MPNTDPVGWLGQVLFAARRLRRAPIFAIAATLLLGTGMAIAAATVSLLNVGLFKDPAREMGLVHIGHSSGTSLPDDVVTTVLAQPPSSFESLAGFGLSQRAVVADGVSVRAAVEAVAGPYFSLFRATPVIGTLIPAFGGGEGDAALVAVISRWFWRSAFGERPDVLGQSIALAGKRLTIIGVLQDPPRPGARGADVWVPASVLPVNILFGRLRADATIELASSEVAGRYGLFDVAGESRTPLVRPGLSAPLPPDTYLDLVWIVGLALAVSLVASVSFGLLLFARMAATQSEMAIRIALGGTSRDLTRLLAFEVFLLAVPATLVAVTSGVLLARFVAGEMIQSSGWQAVLDTSPDWRVFLAVSALTLTVALAVVARLGWRATQVEALGSMIATGGIGGATLRTADTSTRLITAQSAATAALLLCAALVMRNSVGATAAGSLDVTGAALAWIDQAGAATSDAATARARRVLEATEELQGVRSSALISSLPGGWSPSPTVLVNIGERRRPNVHYVSAGAFNAFAISVVKGRTFTEEDDRAREVAAVVSETAARTFWRGLDPIGRRLSIPAGGSWVPLEAVVVGVVSDVEPWGPSRGSQPAAVYLPFSHRPANANVAVFARSDSEAAGVADQMRTSLQRGVPDVGFLSVRTLEDELQERLAAPAAYPRIIGVLGLIVFLVAMGGLYGLMSYLATMRRREIGIRKALGATRLALVGMLARQSHRLLASGIALGITAGLLIGNLFVRSGADFRLLDPVAIGGVAGFLYVAGLIGSIVPFVPAMNAKTERLRD